MHPYLHPGLGILEGLKVHPVNVSSIFTSFNEHDGWRDYNSSTIRILNSAAAYTRENWSVF